VGLLLGGGMMQHVASGQMHHYLAMLDMDEPETEATSIPLSFLAHGITCIPHAPEHYVLFEKRGPGCCIVDLATRRVVHTIQAGAGRHFYGHGVFSADGALLYCTESDIADGHRGWVAVRDAKDFTLLGDFPSFGRAPHDCMLSDGGKTLVIANGGSPVGQPEGPNVAGVDVASATLSWCDEMPDPQIGAGHLAMTSAGDLAVVSAPRDGLDPDTSCGGVSLRPAGGRLVTARDPAEVTRALLGETLSVAIHEPTGTVGATTPLGHHVTFWDLKTGAFKKTLRVPNPRGIAVSVSGDELVVNFGSPPRAARIRADTLVPVDTPENRRGLLSLATGSHITLV
jgi:hypothetical protein